MKRIYELAEEEVLALTDEQVSRYIDYECALEGVPMLPPDPGPRPVNNLPEPDVAFYEVNGLLTADEAHAQLILNAIASGTVLKEEWDYSSNVKYGKEIQGGDYSYPSIGIKRLYSADRHADNQERAIAHKHADAAWKKLDDELKKVLKSRERIHDDVWNHVTDAREKQRERGILRDKFARYFDLADGNATVAMNFLLKAETGMKFDHPQLIQELCPGYGEPEVLPASE